MFFNEKIKKPKEFNDCSSLCGRIPETGTLPRAPQKPRKTQGFRQMSRFRVCEKTIKNIGNSMILCMKFINYECMAMYISERLRGPQNPPSCGLYDYLLKSH